MTIHVYGLRRKARPLAVSPGDSGDSSGRVGMPGLAEGRWSRGELGLVGRHGPY